MKLTNPFRRHIVFILLIAVSALLLATLTVAPGNGPAASTDADTQQPIHSTPDAAPTDGTTSGDLSTTTSQSLDPSVPLTPAQVVDMPKFPNTSDDTTAVASGTDDKTSAPGGPSAPPNSDEHLSSPLKDEPAKTVTGDVRSPSTEPAPQPAPQQEGKRPRKPREESKKYRKRKDGDERHRPLEGDGHKKRRHKKRNVPEPNPFVEPAKAVTGDVRSPSTEPAPQPAPQQKPDIVGPTGVLTTVVSTVGSTEQAGHSVPIHSTPDAAPTDGTTSGDLSTTTSQSLDPSVPLTPAQKTVTGDVRSPSTEPAPQPAPQQDQPTSFVKRGWNTIAKMVPLMGKRVEDTSTENKKDDEPSSFWGSLKTFSRLTGWVKRQEPDVSSTQNADDDDAGATDQLSSDFSPQAWRSAGDSPSQEEASSNESELELFGGEEQEILVHTGGGEEQESSAKFSPRAWRSFTEASSQEEASSNESELELFGGEEQEILVHTGGGEEQESSAKFSPRAWRSFTEASSQEEASSNESELELFVRRHGENSSYAR
eukprot:GHVS01080538.1.p1 GENE.GHVS01080538.1~~GHVS01080538.1.p1  ORF type:complete len:539 (-),score=76.10 GHVS01080538.1:672-2288(-)